MICKVRIFLLFWSWSSQCLKVNKLLFVHCLFKVGESILFNATYKESCGVWLVVFKHVNFYLGGEVVFCFQ